MSAISAGRHEDPGRYEIRVRGHLDQRWSAWFDGLTLTHGSDGTTVIHGPVTDQAALHGYLQKIRDLGLPLISVNHVSPAQPPAPAPGSDHSAPSRKGARHGHHRPNPGN